MRMIFPSVLAALLAGALTGCSGKAGPTADSGSSAPAPAPVLAPTPAPAPSKPVLPNLDGTYLLTEGQILGVRLSPEEIAKGPEKLRIYVIEGDTISDLFGRKGVTQSIRLNPNKVPNEIDFFDKKHANLSDVIHGIYKLEGDKLTIVAGGIRPEERPRDFSYGKNNMILVLTKTK